MQRIQNKTSLGIVFEKYAYIFIFSLMLFHFVRIYIADDIVAKAYNNLLCFNSSCLYRKHPKANNISVCLAFMPMYKKKTSFVCYTLHARVRVLVFACTYRCECV